MAEVEQSSLPSHGGEGSTRRGSSTKIAEQLVGLEGDSTYPIEGYVQLLIQSPNVLINLRSRTTPTPESESAQHLSRQSSFPSTIESIASSQPTSASAPQSESASGIQQELKVTNAEFGFGSMQGEDQLKKSLQGKDRIFLLVLAKEMESFIEKVTLGQEPNIIPSIPLATSSTSVIASMTASFAIASHISSTFQRMLVYKVADWYGLRAVNTPEVSILVGVIGTINPQSAALKLSDLAPRADSPPQKFRIMQRAQPNSSNSSDANGLSRTGSALADDGGSEASSSRVRTLEEREAAYNKARERIYGSKEASEDPVEAVSTIRGPRPIPHDYDDFETAPRPPPTNSEQVFQPVYPSLYDTPKGPGPNHMGPAGPAYDQSASYHHQQDAMRQHYGQQAHMQVQTPQYMGSYQSQLGYPIECANGSQHQQYGMPSYMQQGNPYGVQPMNNGYPGQWGQVQQQQPHPGMYGRQQMPMNQPMPQGWMQPNQGQMPNQPMPMIPQGMQYPGTYGYPQQQQHQQVQQQSYPPLMQPTPTRPAVNPHSSASSSISSRSYQSYHEGSRPHSRGSTTSNMSATSSVRFGAMYPATQGGVYRQKGIKGQMMNGMNSLTGLSTPSDKQRNTRTHSPVSLEALHRKMSVS